MFKIAALGLTLIVCAGNATAVDMAVPTGDFAHSGSGGGSGEAATATAATRATAGAMRDADTTVAAHDRMVPDSDAAIRTDGTPTARGTDAVGSAAGAPSHKAHHNAHWQSLLPGVMK